MFNTHFCFVPTVYMLYHIFSKSKNQQLCFVKSSFTYTKIRNIFLGNVFKDI